ncbi:MAG: glutamate ligase domain-containing protein, partial [Gammaproteobacteria bacterium]
DQFAPLWRELAKTKNQLTFGLHQSADISARWQAGDRGSQLQVTTPGGDMECRLALLGEHNVMNALAAIAAAQAVGTPLNAIRVGLERMQPVPGRLQLKSGLNGSRIIDDTYNANPASLAAAIQVLAGFPGKRILVLGDMGELGEDTITLHAEAGRAAKAGSIDVLYTAGAMAKTAAQAFGKGAHQFEDQTAAIAALQSELSPNVTVLLKGSRLSHMERIADALVAGGAG